ncbi:MAG: glycosyltransferase [Treponema sp.]|nr:glycosyltransferase [Treponema sp.]
MSKPLLSIIVPVYNVEQYISRCLDSILIQSFSDLECIIVDDGSTDNSGNICDSYAKRDKRFQVIHKKNEGVAIARKTGFNISTGSYIHFFDSDDWLYNNIYSTIFSISSYNIYDEIIFGYSRIDENNHICFENIPDSNINKADLLNNEYELTFLLWNKIIKRQVLQNCNFSKTDGLTFSEDSYISYCSLAYSSSVFVIPKALYNYFYRSNSVSRSMSLKNHEDEIKASLLIEEFCKQHNIPYDFPILNKKKFNSKFYLIDPDFSLKITDVYKRYKYWNTLFPKIEKKCSINDKPFFIRTCIFLISHQQYLLCCIIFKIMKTRYFFLKIINKE